MIQEIIITTENHAGAAQIAPMGIHWRDQQVVISPFRPSTTLDNLLLKGCGVINYCDDVRIFSGCLTGRYQWPLSRAEKIDAPRLQDTLAHTEFRVEEIEQDETRPRLLCEVVHEASHKPFRGFNRAQAAVLELAILVSRLDRLPFSKIQRELEYLRTAVDKTAGSREQQAWNWLLQKIDDFGLQRETQQ
ncbi:MAG: DUF447 family protein [Gammaproteobacteria bacterium]|nr:DUF447 family protein [Gammaproteobacteria bacterium]